MTNKKYRQYNIYYAQLTHAIAGHKLYEVSYESVYREMEKLLLGMIIIAADIDDSKGDLDKLGRYIDHLIDEYEKGNDELYMIARSYDKSKPADEQSSIGYLPGMEFFSYLEYMKRLYLYKLPQMRSEDPGDLVLEFSKRRMHIEYLEAIQKKFKKYQREVKKITGFGYKIMYKENGWRWL